MVLIERANDTNENTMPDRNIFAIFYEEISKDPREALRITALNYQEQQLPIDEVLTRLLASAGATPMNRTVKIHSMESKTITPICFRFQVNKYPFGDNVVRKGCVALHYSVHNFTAFLFRATIVIEGEGIGTRSVRFPPRFWRLPDPLKKMMGSNSGPCVSECVHPYRWLYHSTI